MRRWWIIFAGISFIIIGGVIWIRSAQENSQSITTIIISIISVVIGLVMSFLQVVFAAPPPTSPPDNPSKLIRGLNVAIPVVGLLGILLATVIPYHFGLPGPPPQTTPGAAGISTANATPSLVPPGNATSTPQSGIDPLPFYISGHGTLVVSDPMVSNNGVYHWQVSNDSPGSCAFAADGYHIKADDRNYYCHEYKDDLANFVFEAQVKPLKGSGGGFSFRDTGVNGGTYVFEMGSSGHYSIARSDGGNNVHLRDNLLSPVIQNAPSTTYLVDVKMSGNQITIYVNKTQIDSLTDNTYSHGNIGLYVTGDGNVKTEVIFTNVKVWTL